MPCTSVTWVTRRVPSRSRVSWTTTSTAEAICSRMARSGRSIPAMSTRVSSRAMASRGELACTVDSEPSWPGLIAWSMSSDSPPPDHVVLLQLQLDGVLDGDDPLALRDEGREDVQQRRLTGTGTAGDDHV